MRADLKVRLCDHHRDHDDRDTTLSPVEADLQVRLTWMASGQLPPAG
jgi:hypothetical protein